MSRREVTRAGLLLVLALSVASCSDDDNKTPPPATDSGWPGNWPDEDGGHSATRDAGGDAGRPGDIDAAADAAVVDAAAPVTKTACLDRPGTLPAAPAGPLPCELLAPGLVLTP